MRDSDVLELIGYFLSSFGIGLSAGLLIKIFRHAAGFTR